MGSKIDELVVGNYMSEYPISVKPEIPFETVVDFMNESKFSTLIVMDETNALPIGVFTERGIIKHVASGKADEPKHQTRTNPAIFFSHSRHYYN